MLKKKQKWNNKEKITNKETRKLHFPDFAFSLNQKLPTYQANFVAGLQPDIELGWN